MSSFVVRRAALAAALALAPSLAEAQNFDLCNRHPGSVLIFPVHRTGPDRITVISVTNTNTSPANPVNNGGSITLHYEYVNSTPGLNPFCPDNCVIFDRMEFLTPADTLSVLTRCHNPVFAPGQDGYLVVSAQSPNVFGVPVDFDYLIGAEWVINASGVGYSIPAIPFQALQQPGAPTDVNGNGCLDFDGVEYTPVADRMYIDSFMGMLDARLALVNLTGSLRDKNSLIFSVWNDNEFALSTTLEFNCWFDEPLWKISSLFTHQFLVGTNHDPNELDVTCDGIGDVETGWAVIQSRGVTTPGGNRVADDGVFVGSITGGCGGHLLWCDCEPQLNGKFIAP